MICDQHYKCEKENGWIGVDYFYVSLLILEGDCDAYIEKQLFVKYNNIYLIFK